MQILMDRHEKADFNTRPTQHRNAHRSSLRRKLTRIRLRRHKRLPRKKRSTGTLVTVTAMTTDDTIAQVTFLWKTPSGNTVFTDVDNTKEVDGQYEGKDIFTFTSAHVQNMTGDWEYKHCSKAPTAKQKKA